MTTFHDNVLLCRCHCASRAPQNIVDASDVSGELSKNKIIEGGRPIFGSGIVDGEFCTNSESHEVAARAKGVFGSHPWPSGLRRCIQVAVVSTAWVRTPPDASFFFASRGHVTRWCASDDKRTCMSSLGCSRGCVCARARAVLATLLRRAPARIETWVQVHTRPETQVQLHTNAHIATKAQRQARDLAPIICHYAVVRDAASKRARGAAHQHAHRFIQALRQTHNTHN